MASTDLKVRITTHMNSDHSDDLRRYLLAFNGLSSSAAAGAQLIDITLEALTIKSASGVHTVRISPPMTSLADSRARLVEMAGTAREKLGLSDVLITRYPFPGGLGLVSAVGFTCYCLSAAALMSGLIQPGTTAWSLIDGFFPRGTAGLAWSARTLLGPALCIHVTEAWWMARSRLAKHGVETGSALWYKWVLETVAGGFPAFMRFDRLVEEERVKKDAAKH